MSGILAILQCDGAPVERGIVERMLAASPHRARDGQGIWLNNHIALAQQHVVVTPEEVGERQPLVDEEAGLVLAADVRLDNRAELVAALHLELAETRRLSDAALILRAYRRWGTECVAHLLGAYAFALWDATRQQLFFARDALGARDVCYYADDHRLLVASEVSQLLAHPAVEGRVNEGRVAEFLAGLWENHDETYYEGIYYCPPAHCLLASREGLRLWRHWDVDPEARLRYRDPRDYVAHYLELLRAAVRCRLRSVGPVGLSLSGGLDSTALAAVTSELLPEMGLPQERLKTFSYVFDELKSCDERQYIQPVVDLYQLDATYIPCDDRWTLRWPELWPVDRDFILADPYAWLPQAVMEAAQGAGCRVLLAGYYGDVLFTGGHFWALEMLREGRWGELARLIWQRRLRIDWRGHFFDFGLRQLLPDSLRRAYRRLRPRQAVSWHPGLHPELVRRTELLARYERGREDGRFRTPGLAHRYRSLTLNAFEQGASAVRKAYNRHGLELLEPYWDRRLVEFVMALPADQLGRPGWDRWLHRRAFEGRLPDSLCWRKERTDFVPLFKRGMAEREAATVEGILRDAEIVRRKMVRAAWLEEQRRKAFDVADVGYLWRCISLELWLRRYG